MAQEAPRTAPLPMRNALASDRTAGLLIRDTEVNKLVANAVPWSCLAVEINWHDVCPSQPHARSFFMACFVNRVVAGAIGGVLATFPMSAVMLIGHRRLAWGQQDPLAP